MTEMKKAAPAKESGPDNILPTHDSSPATSGPSKIARILEALISGVSLNRFEAERLGDHCLPSTIAVLANTHCLTFQRQPEKVPNRWGKPCPVTRYRLPESEHKRARAVLALLSRKGKKVAA